MNKRNFDLEKVVRISRASTKHLTLDISTNNPPIRTPPEQDWLDAGGVYPDKIKEV